MNEYKTLAFYYDFLLSPFLMTMRAAVTRAVVSLNPVTVVDLCCGTGRQLKILKKTGLENVTGVDLSEEMLAIAQKGVYAPSCIAGDAANTGIDSGSIDLVNINLALHEKSLEDAGKVIKEAYRILKNEGDFIVADYTADSSVPWFPERVITFIEFLAGGEHYFHYKNYRKRGGLKDILTKNGFSLSEKTEVALGGISVEVWKK